VETTEPVRDDCAVPWYVVWCESRAEKKVVSRLSARGCAVWLPTVVQRRRWSDRWQQVTVPLFPGYLFASTHGEGYRPILRTAGVLTLVKEGGRPATLSAAYVDALRRVVEHPATAVEPVEPEPRFAEGMPVVVCDGPLAGFRGTVLEVRGVRKLIVQVRGVGRGLICTIGTAMVRPLTGAVA
jgi:transcription antitermination factor NusG